MDGFNWAFMVGGVAFFFFGLSSARHGLQLLAGERLRMMLGKLTSNRIVGMGLGALLTVILQSSSATTAILVSFAQTQLLTLSQAFSVILGSDIGTTLVVILLSFKKISQYSLFLVALGILLERYFKNQRVKYTGSVVLGFGLIFFALDLMTNSAIPLRDSEIAIKAFEFLASNPMLNLVFAAIFTGIIHASAVTIGLAMALTYSGVLPFEASIPIVLGANIGTCVTAVMACFGLGVPGKRVALAHVLVKFVGVVIVYMFLPQTALLIDKISEFVAQHTVFLSFASAGKIALTHVLFNLFLAILFLPIVGPSVWFIKKLVPDKPDDKDGFKPRYLEPAALDTPSLAFAQAKREMMRIANIAHEMFSECLNLFRTDVDFERLEEKIAGADDKIDILEKEVRFYLAKVSQKNLTETQVLIQVSLSYVGGEFEDIGDAISKEILHLARRKRTKLARFSDEGWAELDKFHKLVMDNFNLTLSMMMQPHEDLYLKMTRHELRLNELEQECRLLHLDRLNQMLPESYETSTIHLDFLSQMRLVNSKLARVVQSARGL